MFDTSTVYAGYAESLNSGITVLLIGIAMLSAALVAFMSRHAQN